MSRRIVSNPLFLCVVLALGIAVSSIAYADVLMVTNTNDSGPGSLRQCIADAQPGDEIQFDPSLDGQPIVLTSGELLIERDLSIWGRGSENTILSGNRRSRVLHVSEGSTVAVAAVTVSNGSAEHSAGIMNYGELTLTDSAVRYGK